jgi:hypothetical protein
MRERRIGLAMLVIALLMLAAHRPSADIRILAAESGDPAPHRVQAAVDLGVVAVSLLWTWSGHRLLETR